MNEFAKIQYAMEKPIRLYLLTFLVFAIQACNQEPQFNGSKDGAGSPSESGKASAHLSWDIPELRENGNHLSLSEIAGYEIVFRQISQTTYSVITVEDNNTSTHTIGNLLAGNYEFMIAVFDTDGLYSDYSEPVFAAVTVD